MSCWRLQRNYVQGGILGGDSILPLGHFPDNPAIVQVLAHVLGLCRGGGPRNTGREKGGGWPCDVSSAATPSGVRGTTRSHEHRDPLSLSSGPDDRRADHLQPHVSAGSAGRVAGICSPGLGSGNSGGTGCRCGRSAPAPPKGLPWSFRRGTPWPGSWAPKRPRR